MNYHADIVWEIDKYLLILCVTLAISVVLYAAVKEFWDGRKARKLERVGKNLHHLVFSRLEKRSPGDLTGVGKVTPLEFLELLKNEKKIVSNEAAEKLKRYFTEAVDFSKTVKIAKKSRNKWRRIEALISLGYVGGAEVMDVIRNSLRDKDEDVAYFSMLALGKIKTQESARILLAATRDRIFDGNRIISILEDFPPFVIDEAAKALGHPDPLIRFWAVKLLTHFRPQHLSENIQKLIGDESSQVRAAVCECLGKIGARESAEAVGQCLHDPVWFVRRRAIKALSRLVGAECIPEIVGFLADENMMIRDGVKKAMAHDILASLPYIARGFQEGQLSLKKDYAEVVETSGYLTVLFSDLLYGEAPAKDKARSLLKGVLSSGAHVGIEGLLSGFEKESRAAILLEIAKIDENLAKHIHQKIEHLLVEI